MKGTEQKFDKFASKITKVTGSHWAFGVAALCVIIWALTGPFFHYSERWQLIINTGTTIVTFLMVFIIQASQNKDTNAIQIKLDELIKVNKDATNQVIGSEEKTSEELEEIKESYKENIEV